VYHARFLTGLIVTDVRGFDPFPYKGRQIVLNLRDASGECQHGGEIDPRTRKRFGPREVVIEARDETAAARFNLLINFSLDLLRGDQIYSPIAEDIGLDLWDENDIGAIPKDTSGHYRRFFNEPNIPRACKIALRVTSRRAYEYALSKWKLSHRVVSVPVIDFDPSQSERMPKSPYAFDHVRYAYAIIMCYSVLEELGLEVRASKEQPSTIKGEWNPAVKDELMKRLKSARVNVTEKFDWMIRGQRTKLEKEHPARVVSPAPWAQWDVRDAVVELVDAIAHVSWLRSKISSHRMKHDLVRLLSIYDVANAQFLARRLLLETLGFWMPVPMEST